MHDFYFKSNLLHRLLLFFLFKLLKFVKVVFITKLYYNIFIGKIVVKVFNIDIKRTVWILKR